MGDYPRSNSSIKRLKEKADIADFILKPLDEDDDATPSMKVKKAIRSRRRSTRNRAVVDLSDPRNCFTRESGSLIPIPEQKQKHAFPKDHEVESLLGDKRVSLISSFDTVKWNFDKGEPDPEVEPPPWMEPFSCDGMFEARYDLLPMELILIIFKQITVSDRLAAGEACRRWMEASYYYEPFLNQTYYHFDRSESGDQVAPFKYFSEGFRYYPKLVFTQVDFNKHSDFWFNHGLGITELTLRSCKIRKKKFLSIMRNLLNLRKLELMQCDELFKNWNIEYNHQEPMFPFYLFCLKHLSLSGCDYFNEYHFERFITMAPNLSSIDVSNCFINLYLSKRITMLDRVMKLINRNRYLMKSLNLADTPCVDDFIWHCLCEIESLQLTHFTVAYNDRVPLKDPGIIRFFSLQTELTYLNLTASTGLSDDCLQKIITSCPRLHTLLIRRCWLISDEGVGATTITKEGVEIVRRPLNTLENLRVLDISNCERISDFAIQTYIIGKRPREMQELQLCMLNNLSESSIYYIAVTFRNIQVLNLDSSANAITDNSLQYIMCYLTELRDLNIVACTKVSHRSRHYQDRFTLNLKNKQTRHYTTRNSFILSRLPRRSRNLARFTKLGRFLVFRVLNLGESNLRLAVHSRVALPVSACSLPRTEQSSNMKLLKLEPDFGNLPTELLVKIFEYLCVSDRGAASYTCWKWYEASKYLGFARQMCLHLVGVEFDDCKPPVADLLMSPHVYPVLKLTRVRMQQSVFSQFWLDFGPAVHEITFEKCMIWRERIIAVFKHLKNLRTARFVECDLLRDDLFKDWKFFENGLMDLRFGSIATLSLAKNNFTELQFEAIVEMMPNLTAIDLSNCFSYVDSVSKTHMLNCIQKFVEERQSKLKSLNMSGISVDDLFLRGLTKCQDLRLQSLSLTYLEKMPQRNPAIVTLLRQQTDMEHLDLSQSIGITDFCLDQIVRNMVNVKVLNLSGCWGVGDYGVSQIFKLQHLEKLHMSKCRITKKAIMDGAGCNNRKNLKEIHLEQIATLDEECIVRVGANFANLTVLNIGGSSSCMTDWSAQYIFRNLSFLREMNIERSTKLLVKIFKYLPQADRTSAGFTCWHWYEASTYLGFARERCLHLVGVEFDDFKPPVSELLLSYHCYPVIKLTRVKLNVYSKFWAIFGEFIREITFEKCMIWRERIISVFKYMPNLKVARFVECDLLRDDLFKNWKFFENGVVNVYFDSIQHLSLARNNFSVMQFSIMVDMMPSLRSVDFSNCFRNVDVAKKTQLLNCILTFVQHRQNDLKELNLISAPVDDIFLRGIVNARGLSLESLSLTYLEKLPQRKPAIIDLLRVQNEIRTLDLSLSAGINDYCIEQIVRNMPELTVLKIAGCSGISDYGIKQIFKLRQLEVLDLSKCRFTKRAIIDGTSSNNKPPLKELFLELLNPLDDECIVKIGSSFKYLKVLSMAGSASCLTDCALQHIFLHLTNLEHLNLERSTKLTDAGFTGIDLPQKTFAIWDIAETFSIDRLKKLRILKVSGCYKITDFALRYSFRFMELKELSLSRCPQITKQGIEKLVTSCPALEFLDLSECPQINDYCVEFIAQNLKRLSTLKLANCPLVSDVALGFLAQYCKNLKYLYVRGCHKLPSDIMERLAKITTLRQVYKS